MSYECAITVAVTELLQARKSIVTQIRDYPTPISGCDAQFNGLLSDRIRVSKAIQALGSHPFVPTPRQTRPTDSVESR